MRRTVRHMLINRWARGGGGPVAPSPVALWDFEQDTYTAPWSLSRSSPATFIDAAGDVQIAAPDTARFDYQAGSPALWVETAAQNRFPGGPFPSASYSDINVTGVTNSGSVRGLEFLEIEDDRNGYFQFNNIGIAGLFPGTPVTQSAYFIGGTTDTFDFWMGVGASGLSRLRFGCNLTTGVATLQANPDSVAVPSASIVDLGGGLRRVSVTGAAISPSATVEECRVHSVDGTLSVAGFQLENGSAATSYIPTDGSVASRASDVPLLTVPAGTWQLVVKPAGEAEQISTVTVSAGDWWPPGLTGRVSRIALFPV